MEQDMSNNEADRLAEQIKRALGGSALTDGPTNSALVDQLAALAKQQAHEATAEPAAVPVGDLAKLLLDTWKRVDPKSNVALYPESYVANFADMARAVLAAQGTQKAAPWSEWQLANASYGKYKAALVDGAEYEIRWLYEGEVMSSSPEVAPQKAEQQASLTVAREFTNELGNAIRITIEGPTSTSENVLTPREVVELQSALNDHLGRGQR
jgi:hypothetical protein